MKHKVLSLAFVILLLTGCSTTYNLNIKADKTFQENIEVLEKNNILELNGVKENIINNYVTPYKGNIEYINYNFNTVYNSDDSGVRATASYQNYTTFLEHSKAYANLFEKFDITNEKSIITIAGTNYLGNTIFSGDLGMSDVAVKIKVPFKVINHNADSVDDEAHTYTWIFNGTIKDKNMVLSYDEATKLSTSSLLKINKSFIAVVVLIFVILGFGLYIMMIREKNNRI